MKLTPKEARFVNEIRATPTGAITVVKFAGEIVNVHIALNTDTMDKAQRLGNRLGAVVPRGTVDISEPRLPPERITGSNQVRTREVAPPKV